MGVVFHHSVPGSIPGLYVGFVVVKVALRQVYCEYLVCPENSNCMKMLHTHPSSGAGATDQSLVGVTIRLNLTTPQEIKEY
jgi:hypothetical protein